MNEFRLISYSISHFSMIGFLLAFTERRYSLRKTTGVLTGLFLVLGATVLFWYYALENKVFWTAKALILVQILLLQGTAVYLSVFRDLRALFTGLCASNYVLPGVMIALYLERLTGWSALAIVLEVLLNAGIFWALVRFLRPGFLETLEENRGDWPVMCLLPFLCYVSAMGLDQAVSGSSRRVEALLMVVFFLATIFLGYTLLARMIARLRREQLAVKEREIMQAGIRALKLEQNELQETGRKIAEHLHEQRQLVQMMQEMLREKNYDGMIRMLEQMEAMTEVHSPTRYTDNAPVNGVLVYYAADLKEKGIRFSVKMELPPQLPVDDWALAVVIGNLLDNAIRACVKLQDGRKPAVSVMGRTCGQTLIEIRNTYDGELDFDAETGLPLSKRGKNHGIGLRSVAFFAQKNQVVFDCSTERGEFIARILI